MKKPKKEEKPLSGAQDAYEWLQILIVALVTIILVFTFVGRITPVVGESMLPTLHEGDVMLIRDIGYTDPQPGDIVVLTKEFDAARGPIVKRIIAVEGQTVDIDYQTGTVYVDGEALDEPYLNEPMEEPWYEDLTSVTVPEGSVFVMGDNRNHSTDSRSTMLGAVEEDYIQGRAVLLLVPGQTPAELGTELCSLSSMGFDQDGAFHIQLRLADGVGGEYGYLQTGMPQVEWEVGAIGEIHTTFQWEGISYYDIRFRTLTAEHFGQFRIDHIWGELTMGQPIEGEWTLSFPLELLQERTIALEEKLNRQVIREITLTATSLKTYAQFEDSDYPTCNGFPLTVYLTDGSTMVIPYNGNCDRRTVFFTEEDTLTYYAPGNKDRWGEDIVWYFPRAIDPREVTGIAIGQRYLPMNQDGTAGPGCWLDRLPE